MTDCYQFRDYTLDVARGCVRRGEVLIELRPKTFAVLQHLVQNADRLVSKEELLTTLWPNLVVTDDSLTRCVSELRAALADAAQQMIRTVPRRGYLFTEPVRRLCQASGPPMLRNQPTAKPPAVHDFRPDRRWLLATGVATLIVALVVATWLESRASHLERPRLSLIVLPFTDLGTNPEQAYLADIVSADLTMALSRLHGTSVIATGTAFTYKSKPVDIKVIGEELKVRYAVQGSVLRQADSVRISAWLVDTQTAKSLWSEQFDAQRVDLSRLEDTIVARLASALDIQLIRADSTRVTLASAQSIDAEDLAIRCEAASMFRKGETAEPSFALCEEALRLDPGNARALVNLALYYSERGERMQSPDPQADAARSREWIAKALELSPNYDAAHCAHAPILAADKRVREAVLAAERCQNLNPSNARSFRILGTLHFFLAEPERALEYLERGMQLSPRDPQLGEFMLFKGYVYLMLRQDDKALDWLRRANNAMPDYPSILAPLSSALALNGHDEEARITLAQYMSSRFARARTVVKWDKNPANSAAFEAFAEHFKVGLRKAGMPEH